MDAATSTFWVTWASIIQAAGTLAAISASVVLWWLQSKRDAKARAQDRAQAEMARAQDWAQAAKARADDHAREGAARDARGHVVAFRLIPILDEIRKSLDQLRENCTNSAQLAQFIETAGFELATVGAFHAMAESFLVAGVWNDSLFDDFDALPPTLAKQTVLLLYKVERYNQSLATEIPMRGKGGDLQRLSAFLRTQQDDIRALLVVVQAVLDAYAPRPLVV